MSDSGTNVLILGGLQ